MREWIADEESILLFVFGTIVSETQMSPELELQWVLEKRGHGQKPSTCDERVVEGMIVTTNRMYSFITDRIIV